MVEYIEREELKKVLSNEAVHCLTFQKTGEARGLIKAKEIISKLPSADLVEVVRCKDCKSCELRYPAKPIGGEAIEGYYCSVNRRYLKPTDYCSCGELREREGK